MSSSLPSDGLILGWPRNSFGFSSRWYGKNQMNVLAKPINVWINKFLVTKKQLLDFDKEEEIILMALKGSFIANWGLVKENIKVRGGYIKNVSFLEWLPQNSLRCISYSEAICLDQLKLETQQIDSHWEWTLIHFLRTEQLYSLQDWKKKKRKKKSCSKTEREWTNGTMREQ